MLPIIYLNIKSLASITLLKRPKISQISLDDNHRISHPRGMYRALWPMRPPNPMVVKGGHIVGLPEFVGLKRVDSV
jgi:hypothetical protein